MPLRAKPIAPPPAGVGDTHLCPPVVRVALMAALGLVGFAVDLEVLNSWGLPLWNMLSLSLPEPVSSTHGSGAAPVFQNAAVHGIWGVFCWMMYRRATSPEGVRTWEAQCWETGALVGLAILWFFPMPFYEIKRSFWRCVVADKCPCTYRNAVAAAAYPVFRRTGG